MSREIKFRGLNAQGEMVYGDLRHDLPNSTAYYDYYPARICWYEDQASCNQPIKKGTEGQYTGLKDVNGVEVYEGDIISDHVGIGQVKYSEEHAAFRVCYGDGLAKWFYDYNLRGEKESIEVIGNIHQNPELIAKAEGE